MKRKLLLITGVIGIVMLSGCGLLGNRLGDTQIDVEIASDYGMEEESELIAEKEEESEQIPEVEEVSEQIPEVEEVSEQAPEVEEESSTNQGDNTVSEKTMEDFYTQPAIKDSLDAQIDSMMAQNASLFSDSGWYVEDNTFTCWYQLSTQIPNPDEAAASMQASVPEDTLKSLLNNLTSLAGVEEGTLQYIYYNADGSEICRIVYPE